MQDPDIPAGSGGSGIVIIRYSMGTTINVTTNSIGYLTCNVNV